MPVRCCNPCRLVSEDLGEAEKSFPARAKSASWGTRHWTTTVPSLDTWLEGWSTSSDLYQRSVPFKGTEVMELDFVDNSDNVGVSTVREVEVSVHQGPVEVTSVEVTSRNRPQP